MENHKHCIFCGDAIGAVDVPFNCSSPNNPLPPDTVGNRPHAWQAVTFGGITPTIKERARIAAEQARQSTEPVRILSLGEDDGQPLTNEHSTAPEQGEGGRK